MHSAQTAWMRNQTGSVLPCRFVRSYKWIAGNNERPAAAGTGQGASPACSVRHAHLPCLPRAPRSMHRRLGTTKAALRIYDPFFCEGRMLAHMASLGFESVYNRNEDFYTVREC